MEHSSLLSAELATALSSKAHSSCVDFAHTGIETDTSDPLDHQSAELPASRREFLKTVLTASVLSTACSSLAAPNLLGSVRPDGIYLDDSHPDKKGSVSGLYTIHFRDFPVLRNVFGSVRMMVPVLRDGIIVTRSSATAFTAVNEICTHAGCGINTFDEASQTFFCPCHNSRFDIQGRVQPGSAARINLRTYSTVFTPGNDFMQVDIPGFTVDVLDAQEPTQNTLGACVPNPASGISTIDYTINKASHVKLAVYSLLGKEVSRLVDKQQEAGSHKVSFDANSLPRGVYLYRIETSTGFVQTRKMTISE
jgi:Rieske Fe-S protein